MPHDDHHHTNVTLPSGPSLRASWLRRSALWRLTAAGAAIAVLWLGVVWALT